MEEIDSVDSLLSVIQKELKVPKTKFNSFGKYKYRSTEGIIEAVKKLLPEGAYLIIEDLIQVYGDNEQQRFYIKATATLKYKKEKVSCNAYARESLDKKGMDDSQQTGAASSYARKYALNGLFCIDDSKDADRIDVNEKIDNKKENIKLNRLISLVNSLKVSDEIIEKWLNNENVDDFIDFNDSQCDKYIKFLESKRGE